MMAIKSLLVIAAAFTSVLAAPAPVSDVDAFDIDVGPAPLFGSEVEETSPLEKRDQARIYYCKNINWNGACRNQYPTLGRCYNVASDWNDVISSIDNQTKDNHHCVWYEHPGCSGGTYENQQDSNLADGNGFWNDRISSYSCRYR